MPEIKKRYKNDTFYLIDGAKLNRLRALCDSINNGPLSKLPSHEVKYQVAKEIGEGLEVYSEGHWIYLTDEETGLLFGSVSGRSEEQTAGLSEKEREEQQGYWEEHCLHRVAPLGGDDA